MIMQIYVIILHVAKLGYLKRDRMAKWEESKREEYWQKICLTVQETSGQIVTYNNEPINAFSF